MLVLVHSLDNPGQQSFAVHSEKLLNGLSIQQRFSQKKLCSSSDQFARRRMKMSASTFTPGPTPNTVRAADGIILTAPDGWALLPPGDAALTRRVKAAGDHWVVQEKRGRKIFSRGVWAPAPTIDRIRAEKGKQREVRRVLARTDWQESIANGVRAYSDW